MPATKKLMWSPCPLSLGDADQHNPEDDGKGGKAWMATNMEDSSVWES
jgi:hypothetical protein